MNNTTHPHNAVAAVSGVSARPLDYVSEPSSGWPLIWSQTLALLLDAYRQLNSQKLFWLSMIISVVVVVAFAFTGINETGWTVFGYTIEGGWNTSVIKPDVYYKFLFAVLGVPIWLTWGATILALVSTSPIFPDMLSGGAIDLYLSKPISRWRLLLTRFATGLMFAGAQIFVFTAACFLLIGFRGGSWEPGLFLALPILLIFYSYLFSICMVIGLLTRSTIASLMLTLVAWVMLFSVQATEGGLLMPRVVNEQREIALKAQLKTWDERLATLSALPPDKLATSPKAAFEFQREKTEKDLKEVQKNLGTWQFAHNVAFAAYAIFPKTDDTVQLLSRTLIKAADLPDMGNEERDRSNNSLGGVSLGSKVVQDELTKIRQSRGPFWTLSTSIGFTALIVFLGGWYFARKDY